MSSVDILGSSVLPGFAIGGVVTTVTDDVAEGPETSQSGGPPSANARKSPHTVAMPSDPARVLSSKMKSGTREATSRPAEGPGFRGGPRWPRALASIARWRLFRRRQAILDVTLPGGPSLSGLALSSGAAREPPGRGAVLTARDRARSGLSGFEVRGPITTSSKKPFAIPQFGLAAARGAAPRRRLVSTTNPSPTFLSMRLRPGAARNPEIAGETATELRPCFSLPLPQSRPVVSKTRS